MSLFLLVRLLPSFRKKRDSSLLIYEHQLCKYYIRRSVDHAKKDIAVLET